MRAHALTVVGLMLFGSWTQAQDARPADGLEPARPVLSVPAEAGKAANGLTLELRTPPEKWYVVGDRVELPLAFVNTTRSALAVSLGHFYFGGTVRAIDEEGRALPTAPPVPLRKNPGPRWQTVDAAGEHSLVLHLDRFVVAHRPGTFIIWVEFEQDPQEGRGEPPARAVPWVGRVVSNPVQVEFVSRAEFWKRCAGEAGDGPLAGLSLDIKPARPVFGVGEPLEFELAVRNSANVDRELPWQRWGVLRRGGDADIGVIAAGYPNGGLGTGAEQGPSRVPANGELKLAIRANDEHIANHVMGEVTYRAEFWQRHPFDAAVGRPGPLDPVRLASNEASLRIEVRDRDVAGLLDQAVKDREDGKTRRRDSRALDALCYFLDVALPIISEADPGQGARRELVEDLILAQAMVDAYDAAQGADAGMEIDAKGLVVYVPRVMGQVGGIAEPTDDYEAFADAFVRMRRCGEFTRTRAGGYVYISEMVRPVPHAPMAAVSAVARAVYDRARAQDVYLYRLEMAVPDLKDSRDRVELHDAENYAVTMVLGVDSAAEGTRPVYYVVPHPDPDPRPNFVRGMTKQQLAVAMAGLQASENQFISAHELGLWLDGREKRHEQVVLVPLSGARVGHVQDAIRTFRKWNSVPIWVTVRAPEPARTEHTLPD